MIHNCIKQTIYLALFALILLIPACQIPITGSWLTSTPALSTVCDPPDCEIHTGGHFSFRRAAGAEKAILFVHGFGSNANEAFSFWPQRYFLDKEFGDFDIWVFDYETGLTCSRASETVDLVSSQLAQFILQDLVNKRNKPYEEFHIVAHSLGGVISRKTILSLLKQGNSDKFGLQTLHLADSPNYGIGLTRLVTSLVQCQAPDVDEMAGRFQLNQMASDWKDHVFNPNSDLPPEQQKDIETYVYLPQISNFVSEESAKASFDNLVKIKGTDHWSLVKVTRDFTPDIYDEVKGQILWYRNLERPNKPAVFLARFARDPSRTVTEGIKRDIIEELRRQNLSQVTIVDLKREIASNEAAQRVTASRIARQFRPAVVIWGAVEEGFELTRRLRVNILIEPARLAGWQPDIVFNSPYQFLVTPRPPLGGVLTIPVVQPPEGSKQITPFAKIVLASALMQTHDYRRAYDILLETKLPPEISNIDRLRLTLLQTIASSERIKDSATNCLKPILDETERINDTALSDVPIAADNLEALRLVSWLRFNKFSLAQVRRLLEDSIAQKHSVGPENWRRNQIELAKQRQELTHLRADFAKAHDRLGEAQVLARIAGTYLGLDIDKLRATLKEAREIVPGRINKWSLDVALEAIEMRLNHDKAKISSERLIHLAKEQIDAGDGFLATFPLFLVADEEYNNGQYVAALETLKSFGSLNRLANDPGNSFYFFLGFAAELAILADRDKTDALRWISKAENEICKEEMPIVAKRYQAFADLLAVNDSLPLIAQAKALHSAIARYAMTVEGHLLRNEVDFLIEALEQFGQLLTRVKASAQALCVLFELQESLTVLKRLVPFQATHLAQLEQLQESFDKFEKELRLAAGRLC